MKKKCNPEKTGLHFFILSFLSNFHIEQVLNCGFIVSKYLNMMVSPILPYRISNE